MEVNSSNQKPDQEQSQACGVLIIYGIVALIISICWAYKMPLSEATTFRRTIIVILAIIVGTPLGVIGGAIGDVLRKIAHPDAIFTSGGMWEILMTKLFWAIGPQLIGIIGGAGVGAGLTSYLLVTFCFS